MSRPLGRGWLGYWANRPRARNAIALAVGVFFCLQVSRFYLSVQLNPMDCPHHHPAPVMGAGMHSHHMTEAPSHSQEGCFYFQCCKETYDGVGLSPAQPFGLPITLAHVQPETTRVILLSDSLSLVEHFLPPPFQPPRA